MLRPTSRTITVALIIAAGVAGAVVIAAIGLRLGGLLIPYQVPQDGMQPTIRSGDCVLMEGLTYRGRRPARGELLVFVTTGIPNLAPDTVFVKRVVGLPGDKLRIADGQLLVNGQPTVYHGPDRTSVIRYANMGQYLRTPAEEFHVPAGSYFVLGDNSTNSLDSRYWGVVPQANVRGRVWFRYWPLRSDGTGPRPGL